MPVDNETLVMADRSGVEIDYCPKCRGVWLDRGELDKIVERTGVGGGQRWQREDRHHRQDNYAKGSRMRRNAKALSGSCSASEPGPSVGL